MTARDKLAEANFFLEKLQSVSMASMDFTYYTSACASALYGSLQHLLYDYAKRYWPNITDDDYLNPKLFRLLAKATKRTDALDCVKWYDTLADQISKNRDAKIVWNIRHVDTHRGTTSFAYQFEELDMVDMSGGTTFAIPRLEYSELLPSGEIVPSGASPPTSLLLRELARQGRLIVHFGGHARRPVQEILEGTFTFVRTLIDEAEAKFETV